MAKVIPLKPAVEPPPPPPSPAEEFPCVVCGGACFEDGSSCNRCKAEMHHECYYGRVLPMSEWLTFVAVIHSADTIEALDKTLPAVLCPACRLAVELGDTVMIARVLRLVRGGQQVADRLGLRARVEAELGKGGR